MGFDTIEINLALLLLIRVNMPYFYLLSNELDKNIAIYFIKSLVLIQIPIKYCYDNDNHAIELNADNAFNYWFLPGY